MPYTLGISAFFHDSAAALIKDGDIIAAVQEERFSREKYDDSFPQNAIDYCLSEAKIGPESLSLVAFYEQPFTKFERLIETYVAYAPAGIKSFKKAIPLWVGGKLYLHRVIRKGLKKKFKGNIVYPSHHESHAASAFFPSPYEKAAIITLDGVGEWTTTTIGYGEKNHIHLQKQIRFPHSLGLLYTAFTYYCGFKVNSGEYKLMGLAPYGVPKYVDLIYSHLIDVKLDGSYRLNMDYFNYCQGLTMTNEKFHKLFGGPPRKEDELIEKRHMDLAASIQRVTEEVIFKIADHAYELTGCSNLVIAGGVGLNCVANGKLLDRGPFTNIWVQPAAGDAGGALGAALFAWYELLEKDRKISSFDTQKCSLLGPSYNEEEIKSVLDKKGAIYHYYSNEDKLLDIIVDELCKDKVVGWFQGRTEFGPRALGSRSILGNPCSPKLQSQLNLKIKFRESFRPFAPTILRECLHEWVELEKLDDSPYMLFVAPVKDRYRRELSEEEKEILKSDNDLAKRVNIVRSVIPAVTHVDWSARIQTVDERHGRYYRLIKKFYEKTHVPILINTSFNLSWEPIVLKPEEAYFTFMQSEMDVLVIQNFILFREEQPLGFVAMGSLEEKLSPWQDPYDGSPLVVSPQGALNTKKGIKYEVDFNIPRLFVSDKVENDVTETVKEFYEKTPFPNYDDIDNSRALIEKSRRSIFAKLLNEQIPFGARVLEVGCGTGQLTNFLAIGHRSVLGTDICLNSLKLAEEFRQKNGIKRACFSQMNLFKPALKENYFDYIISLGVLHHTSNAREAFKSISRLIRPGGYVVVGLYNSYTRNLHYLRKLFYRVTGIPVRILDPHFKDIKSNSKKEAWFSDQYCHPHETVHSLDEVLDWFNEAGFEFINSIPKPVVGLSLSNNEKLFEPVSSGTSISRFFSQLFDMGSGYREGGFFVVIGRKIKCQVLKFREKERDKCSNLTMESQL